MTLSTTDEPALDSSAAAQGLHKHMIHLPPVRHLVRHAGGHLLVGAVVPGVTFYGVLATVNLRWALLATLLWSYAVITAQLGRRRAVPGIIVIGALMITARTAIALITNSSFIYFLQPGLANFCVALAFLGSVLVGRPLTRKLADDFCAFPETMDAHPGFARFFVRLTVLWAVVCTINGAGSLLLLMHQSLGGFLALRSVLSYGLVIGGTGISYLWFRRTMKGEGVGIAFGPAPALG